jgi:hypothetical protein
MHLKAWLRELTTRLVQVPSPHGRFHPAKRKRLPCKLHLEALEERSLLSAVPVTVVQASTDTAFTTTSATYKAIPGLSGTVTVTANQPVDASAIVDLYNATTTAKTPAQVALVVDGTVVQQEEVGLPPKSGATANDVSVPLHWALTNLSAGNHTVEVEVRSTAGLAISLDTSDNSSLTLLEYNPNLLSTSPVSVAQAATSGPFTTTSTSYVAVPGLSGKVTTSVGQIVNASAIVDLAQKGGVIGGTNVGLAALVVDGHVVQTQEFQVPTGSTGLNATTLHLNWTLTNLAAGTHTVTVDVRLEKGAGVGLDGNGNSSLTLTQFAPLLPATSPATVVQASSSSFVTTSKSYTTITGLSGSVTVLAGDVVDADSVLNLMNVSGSTTSATVAVALAVDGQIVEQQEVTLASVASGYSTTTVPLDWALPNLSTGSHTISILIKSENGQEVLLNPHGNSTLTLTKYSILPVPNPSGATPAAASNLIAINGAARSENSTPLYWPHHHQDGREELS